jgi:hypothetical protein
MITLTFKKSITNTIHIHQNMPDPILIFHSNANTCELQILI